MSERTGWICRTGLGIALFVVLTMCLQVPVFENYYLCLGYIVMAVWLSAAGTASGTAVGILGVILYCVLTGGLRGMPGWALGNAVIGVILGNVFRLAARFRNPWTFSLLWLFAALLACALGILGVKSMVECILYGQPFALRAVKNSTAFLAAVFVLWVGLPVSAVVDRALFPRT